MICADKKICEKNEIADKFLKAVFVLLLVCAAMGECLTINAALGGLPKVISVGIIAVAVAYAFIKPDIKKLKTMIAPTVLYFSLIVFLMLWSLVIWIMSFSDTASIIRGGSKMIYQTISIMTAVSAVYMFGFESINLFALSLCITNGLIMLYEVPNYGIAESISSLIDCIVKFGDTTGYAARLEIHDLTFVFGQLIIYYAAFAPKSDLREKKTARKYLAACIFFFVVGMKRIAIPAVILFVLLALAVRNFKKGIYFFVIFGSLVIAFFFAYIYGVRTGAVSRIFNLLGIDMMGRDYIWRLTNKYYTLSPGYMGKGFEFVDTVARQWVEEGLLKAGFMFHNDILKVFVEMGFPGFLIWSALQYVIYPIFWLKYADAKTAYLYWCILGYMTITYLTDNTAFYFWSTMSLKLVVLAYASFAKKMKIREQSAWKPPTKAEIIDLMANLSEN
mgnify:CR=1 FL=1